MSVQNYYDVLGVLPTASDEEIRKAYKTKALQCHPDKADKNGLTSQAAHAQFKKLNEAYAALSASQRPHDDPTDSQILSPNPSQPRNDPIFCPKAFNEETNAIIDSDDVDLLSSFLESENFDDSLSKSVLYRACERGKLNIVRYLIEVRKLTPHLKIYVEHFLSGPIFKVAARIGNLALVQYLLEVHHVDIESKGITPGFQCSALSQAVEKGHEEIAKYLISKGASLSPEVSYSNLLGCAICSKKLSMVQLVVEAGAYIDHYALNDALRKGLSDIVLYLLQKKPNLKAHSYTVSAGCAVIESGNLELLKHLEREENLGIFEKNRDWWRDNMDLPLIEAGARSVSIEMMTFLLDEKGLDEKIASNPKYIEASLSAVCIYGIDRNKKEPQKVVKFLRFLMEERGFVLSKSRFKNFLEENHRCFSLEIECYLQSYLLEPSETKETLLNIATNGLESFSLHELWKLHNSKALKRIVGKLPDTIYSHIEERKTSIEELRNLFLENRETREEALFYYSTYHFAFDLSKLKLLWELGIDLNCEDDEGVAAIHRALESSIHNKIIQFYIDRGTDLSKKNKYGETAAEIIARCANKK